MDDSSEYYADSFKIELDNAVRKSWSEQQGASEPFMLKESPMGTPTNQSYIPSSSGSDLSSNRFNSPSSNYTRSSVDNIAGNYPIERHYSLTENTDESISDILLDLNLGTPENSDTNAQLIRENHLRRSSVMDVQRVRQLLNPRSSFSGASSQEPQLPTFPKFCWVTLLPGQRPELTESILVLNKSLLAVKSRYKLFVLHNSDADVSQLESAGIDTLNYSNYMTEQIRTTIRPNSKLILFIALEKIFDLVCYLSPTSMILENVDELLDSNEVSDEIDNDTCVLLSNELPREGGSDDDIQTLILRPSSEVAMCVIEFFTVYGVDEDDRRGKIASMCDAEILRTLFAETWGHLSSKEYAKTLNTTESGRCTPGCKIVDLRHLSPWRIQSTDIAKINDSTLSQVLIIWKQFANSW